MRIAVGRGRHEPAIVPPVEMWDFARVPASLRGPCPLCRLPVAVLRFTADDGEHVAYDRPPTATLCCPYCGGLSHRGMRADFAMPDAPPAKITAGGSRGGR